MQPAKRRFQLTVDSDSVFITRPEKGAKSRVTLSNLDDEALQQIARGIVDSGLAPAFRQALDEHDDDRSCPIQTTGQLYAFYLGLPKAMSTEEENRLKTMVGSYASSCTIMQGEGTFETNTEHTYVIQLTLPDLNEAAAFAATLRKAFDQKGVGFIRLGTYFRSVDT